MKAAIILAAGIILLSSCNDTGSHEQQTQTANATATPPATSNLIVLNAGDDMKFDQQEFNVAVGEPVTLTLNHTGKAARDIMGHNFVLLDQGTDVAAFAAEALNAKATDYIPEQRNNVLASTRLLGGGESDEIEFTLTKQGEYPFLCSFPGHAGIMRGKLIVW